MYSIVQMPRVYEDYAEIFLFGDLHYGSSAQDRKLIKESVDYVIETPNCFGVSVGDILDNSIKGKFGIIGKDKSVKEAYREFVEDFSLLIEYNKLIGAVPGNHDIRPTNSMGSEFDPIEEYLALHGIKYGTPHMIISSHVGRSQFTGFVTHGSGGGTTAGNVLNNNMRNRTELSDADWFAQGHFHIAIEAPVIRRPYFDRRSGTVQTQEQSFICVGSYLKKHGYAAVGRFLDGGTYPTILELHASPRNYHTKPKFLQTRLFRGL